MTRAISKLQLYQAMNRILRCVLLSFIFGFWLELSVYIFLALQRLISFFLIIIYIKFDKFPFRNNDGFSNKILVFTLNNQFS